MPRVLDFGVAKALGRAQSTSHGEVKGKAAYMAPEQVRGETVDRRADVFAAGIVVWELLTGRRLFEADSGAASMMRILDLSPTPPSELAPGTGLPPELDHAVLRALARDRTQRFATAAAMADALEAATRPAPAAQVAAWVQDLAGATLRTRSEQVRQIEAAPPLSTSALSVPALTPRARHRDSFAAELTERDPLPSYPKRRSRLAALLVPLALVGIVIGVLAARAGMASSASGEGTTAPSSVPEMAVATPTPAPAPRPHAERRSGPSRPSGSVGERRRGSCLRSSESRRREVEWTRSSPAVDHLYAALHRRPERHPRAQARMPVTRRTLTLASLVTALTLGSVPAFADPVTPPAPAPPTKAECVASHSEAQRLRLAGQLTGARAQLLLCANPGCPAPVTVECVPWLAEVERALPTVVFEARLADGSDAVDVTVLVDGVKVQDRLDGRAIAVDPGARLVRFVLAAGPSAPHPLERRVVVAEGEKTRVVRAEFPPAEILTPVPPIASSASGGPHWSTYVLGGASVLSFAGFAYFGVRGDAAKDTLDAMSCKPGCSPTQTGPVTSKYTDANVFLGAGIATAAAAIIVGITTWGHRATTPAPAPASARVDAQVPRFDRSMLK